MCTHKVVQGTWLLVLDKLSVGCTTASFHFTLANYKYVNSTVVPYNPDWKSRSVQIIKKITYGILCDGLLKIDY